MTDPRITYEEQFDYLKREFLEISDFPVAHPNKKPSDFIFDIHRQFEELKKLLNMKEKDHTMIAHNFELLHSDIAKLYRIRRKITESLKIKYVRLPIKTFSEEMERNMREHDRDKGDSWEGCDLEYLFFKLDDEIKEWHEKVPLFDEPYANIDWIDELEMSKVEADRQELIDIANICMMLHNRLKEKDGGKE